MFTKITAGLAVCLLSSSAFAVERDITVTANVDTDLAIMSSTGGALPASVDMEYIPGPGGGLQPVKMLTKIYSNDQSKDMVMSLANDAQLVEITGASAQKVPLKVTYMGKALSTGDTALAASEVFPGGGNATSIVIPLEIAAVTPTVTSNGVYSGVVTLRLVHDASTI
jgi:hypothetical protein